MPRILQYEAPALGLQPTDEGVRAAAAAGGRIGRNFDQLASSAAAVGGTFAKDMGGAVKDAGNVVLDYFETRERQAGAAAFAQMQDNLTNQWNSIAQKADPNDPTVAARFREDVLEPTLEKYREGFLTEGGQRFAETRIEQTRQHLFAKSAADMSSLAAQAVAVNMRQTANSFSNTANSDPSSVPTLLGQVDGLVNDIVGGAANIRGADAAKVRMAETQRLKESIVKSGAIGAIAKSGNPEAVAKEWGERYKDFISGDELKMLAVAAKTQARANLLTSKQLEQYQRQQQADASHKALSKNWTDSVSFDDNGKAIIKPEFFKNVMDIERAYPGAATERARTMINWAQSEQRERREVIITDKDTQAGLYEGLFRTDKPTTDVDILRAAAEHKLDDHDTRTLLQLQKTLEDAPLKGPIYQGVMGAVKGSLGDSEKGHENYAKFLQTFIPDYLRQQRAGILQPNALDLRDENSLISKSLAPWKLTPQEKMVGAMMKRFGGGGDLDVGAALGGEAPKISPVLPPVEQREVGKVYPTGRGRMKWTGTGWVVP